MKTDPVIIIRTDGGQVIGSGHIMRCLALADVLKDCGAKVIFVCRELAGHLCGFIESRGFRVLRLPAPSGDVTVQMSSPGDSCVAWLGVDWQTDLDEVRHILTKSSVVTDWLIADHYALDARWENGARSFARKIMVIDDLANRPHDCEVLLDQNLSEKGSDRYRPFVPEFCKTLIGPDFALLGKSFYSKRGKLRVRDGSLNRILVSFGGVDSTGEIPKVLEAIRSLGRPNISTEVVVGAAETCQKKIEEDCRRLSNCKFHVQIDYMADLMDACDLAIGAAGSMTWERCFMGLPSIVAIAAENQQALAVQGAKKGCLVNLGWGKDLTSKDYYQALRHLDAARLQAMSCQARQIIDGEGCHRVAGVILSFCPGGTGNG